MMSYPCTGKRTFVGSGRGVPVISGVAMRQGPYGRGIAAGRGHRRLPVCTKRSYDLQAGSRVDRATSIAQWGIAAQRLETPWERQPGFLGRPGDALPGEYVGSWAQTPKPGP